MVTKYEHNRALHDKLSNAQEPALEACRAIDAAASKLGRFGCTTAGEMAQVAEQAAAAGRAKAHLLRLYQLSCNCIASTSAAESRVLQELEKDLDTLCSSQEHVESLLSKVQARAERNKRKAALGRVQAARKIEERRVWKRGLRVSLPLNTRS